MNYKNIALSVVVVICLASCAFYKVRRVGRNERVVEVSDSSNLDSKRMMYLAERKARLLGCSSIEYLDIQKTSARILCIGN